MDQYQKQLERLTNRVRMLETKSFQTSMSDEVMSLIDDLGLELSGNGCEKNRALTVDGVRRVLKNLDHAVESGEDFVKITDTSDSLFIVLDKLPVITILNAYRLNSGREMIPHITRAANEVMEEVEMVKITLDDESIWIKLVARHEDEDSFRRNVPFYLEQMLTATDMMMRKYDLVKMDMYFRQLSGAASRQIS